MGSVLVFLPQITILFAFILLLEDSGYLPRAALLLDNAMSRSGLSGRAFIPLLSSFACAVPAVMSARIIHDLNFMFNNLVCRILTAWSSMMRDLACILSVCSWL